jgi:predicted outer membrane repeat protein
VTLTDNTFSHNVATQGGAVYCDTCTWSSLIRNVFTSNIASYGGDIYLKDPDYPVTFESHQHTGSSATSNGAAVYFYDQTTPKTAIVRVR